MKKLLSLVLALAMLFALSATALAAEQEIEFSDIPTGWSHDAVVAAIENGLLQGYDGKVDPKGNLSRAQMAAVIVRAMGGTVKADISAFNDVSVSEWYHDELSVAVQMGVFEGDGTGLKPNDSITREQVALVLSRAFKLTAADTDLSGFADADQISSWARGGVAALVKAGYMQGDGTNLNPTSFITREEFAQLMYNLVDAYITEAGTLTEIPEGNLVIRAADVILKGVHITGDVIVGDGVGDGDFTLKDCTLDGRLVVRGGGVNTIYIFNTDVSGDVVLTRRDGAVHVSADDASSVKTVNVEDGKDKVVLSGGFNSLSVGCDVEVVLEKADVGSVNVVSNDARIVVNEDSVVSSVVVAASNAMIEVAGTVTSVNVASGSENTSLTGTGTVELLTAESGSSGISVSTIGTIIVNNSSSPVSASEVGEIPPGTTGENEEPGGGGGGGTPTTYYKLTLTIDGSDAGTEPDVTASTADNAYLIGKTPFYVEVFNLLNSNLTALNTAFGSDPDFNALKSAGRAAYYGSAGDWTAFVSEYSSVFSGKDPDLLRKNATFSDLLGSHTLTYTTYTVTVTIAAL